MLGACGAVLDCDPYQRWFASVLAIAAAATVPLAADMLTEAIGVDCSAIEDFLEGRDLGYIPGSMPPRFEAVS